VIRDVLGIRKRMELGPTRGPRRRLVFDEAEFARLIDLDRAFQDEGTHGDGGRDGDDEPTALLMPGEQWIIGPVASNVFKGLDNYSLNAAEKAKIAKMLK
jgi:hypothetical protein